MILPDDEKIGVAVVGIGQLTKEEILPALRTCSFAKLSALVTSDMGEGQDLARQYDLPNGSVYSYDDFERLKDNEDVGIVYIVLPNSMHLEYTRRAAAIGKHVLCEKPMANNVEDCRKMIAACEDAGVLLMIAYRCQYEPYNLEVIKRAHDGSLGGIRIIEACNSQMEDDPNQWRLKEKLAGGGALPDIGVYCLNAARYVTKEEPEEVFAWTYQPKDDPRFMEVEARMNFVVKFPSGVIAHCSCAYDGYEVKDLSVTMEKGRMDLKDAFSYGEKELIVKHTNDKGVTVAESVMIEAENQFALEIDHFADCIINGKTPKTGGDEGLRDQIIIEALYRSAEEGVPVRLEPQTISGSSTITTPASRSTSSTASSVNGR